MLAGPPLASLVDALPRWLTAKFAAIRVASLQLLEALVVRGRPVQRGAGAGRGPTLSGESGAAAANGGFLTQQIASSQPPAV